jgi:hypothetical protein
VSWPAYTTTPSTKSVFSNFEPICLLGGSKTSRAPEEEVLRVEGHFRRVGADAELADERVEAARGGLASDDHVHAAHVLKFLSKVFNLSLNLGGAEVDGRHCDVTLQVALPAASTCGAAAHPSRFAVLTKQTPSS